jgi:hypothetical protein
METTGFCFFVTVHGYFDIIEQRTQCQNSRFQLGIL